MREESVNGRVRHLSSAPVKGMALVARDAVRIGPAGLEGDRRFAVIDAGSRVVNGKRRGPLATIVPELRADGCELALHLPDGRVVAAEVVRAGSVQPIFHGEPRPAHEVAGPFAAALSAWAGEPLRLVELDAPGAGVDRGEIGGAVTILSAAALAAMAVEAGLPSPVDHRRFRMSVIVAGVDAHAEDDWIDRPVRLGTALVVPRGNVGRCAVTTHDPDTGRRSLDTLDLIARSRGDLPTTEALPFGVWAQVLEPGEVRLGDPCGPLDRVDPVAGPEPGTGREPGDGAGLR